VILAGSVGTAMALATANALKQAGNHVILLKARAARRWWFSKTKCARPAMKPTS